MKVLVNGLGNIGTSLCQLLAFYKNELGIQEIVAHKRKIAPWNEAEIALLESKGVKIVESDAIDDVLTKMDYIFEATPNGIGLENLTKYKRLTNLKGASAQGSEKGFGLPFITGVNDQVITNQPFVNVVSCNTHGTSAILHAFGGSDLSNIVNADVVVVRRSEDIGNHQRLVSGNVIARHLHESIGTHHAIDVIDLYKTLGVQLDLTSSDITTPSQFLHAVRFNLNLKENPTDHLDSLKNKNHFLGFTNKFDSNVVFEIGRRNGFAGRLFNHAIIVQSNLMINGNNICGWAFVPQEGNTLLSTLHAFLLQTNHPQEADIITKIKADLLILTL